METKDLKNIILEGEFMGKKFKINLLTLLQTLSQSKEQKFDMGFVKLRIYKITEEDFNDEMSS